MDGGTVTTKISQYNNHKRFVQNPAIVDVRGGSIIYSSSLVMGAFQGKTCDQHETTEHTSHSVDPAYDQPVVAQVYLCKITFAAEAQTEEVGRQLKKKTHENTYCNIYQQDCTIFAKILIRKCCVQI